MASVKAGFAKVAFFVFSGIILTMVVRMRHTRAHTANRRSHHKVKGAALSVDSKTGSTHLRHRVDMTTGMYRGKKVIDVVKKVEKKQAKAKAK